jgi:polyvinyl alcohol dehydrogenase (cytochrome)
MLIGSLWVTFKQRYTTTCCVFLIAASCVSGQDGPALYKRHCAACHDQVSPRTPSRSTLETMPASRILRAMDFGLMMSVAQPLRRTERVAIANFLGTLEAIAPLPARAFCSEKATPASTRISSTWIGWSPTFTNTRFQQGDEAGLTAAETTRLKLKWAFGFSGDIVAFGAPTVGNGVLFVGSAAGVVHALNAKSGCLYRMFQADGPVRSAPLIVESGGKHIILFGDLIGWFYAVDAENGKQIWRRRIDDHEATRLTGSPAFHKGLVFVPASSWEESRATSSEYPCCTFRGSVSALRASDGLVIWKTYLVEAARKTSSLAAGPLLLGRQVQECGLHPRSMREGDYCT